MDLPDRRPGLSRAAALDTVRVHLRDKLSLPEAELAENDQLDLLPGADSVRLMQVVAELEGELGVEFDDGQIRRAATVGDLADMVTTAVAMDRAR